MKTQREIVFSGKVSILATLALLPFRDVFFLITIVACFLSGVNGRFFMVLQSLVLKRCGTVFLIQHLPLHRPAHTLDKVITLLTIRRNQLAQAIR